MLTWGSLHMVLMRVNMLGPVHSLTPVTVGKASVMGCVVPDASTRLKAGAALTALLS